MLCKMIGSIRGGGYKFAEECTTKFPFTLNFFSLFPFKCCTFKCSFCFSSFGSLKYNWQCYSFYFQMKITQDKTTWYHINSTLTLQIQMKTWNIGHTDILLHWYKKGARKANQAYNVLLQICWIKIEFIFWNIVISNIDHTGSYWYWHNCWNHAQKYKQYDERKKRNNRNCDIIIKQITIPWGKKPHQYTWNS